MRDLVQDTRFQGGLPRRLAAIAFLDVVGFSNLMGADEESTLREWSAVRRGIIEPRVATWRGRVVNSAGDGLFIDFHSALDAFRWAVDVQDALAARDHGRAPMQVRIALHLGDVIDGPDGEVNGDGVNTAARLQAQAEPGGVVVSQAMMNEVRGRTDATFSDLGELRLKNIARPVRAYCLRSAVRADTPARGLKIGRVPPVGAWWAKRRGVVLVATLSAALVMVPLSFLANLGGSGLSTTAAAVRPAQRDRAESLTRAGKAIVCQRDPCPREWLAARDLYEQAIAADPDYAPPYIEAVFTYTNFVTSGISLNESGDLRAAERLATHAAAMAPEAARAHEARAAVLRQDPDRLEDALAAYLRSLAIQPDKSSPRANAGWMLVLLGRPAEAEAFLRTAIAEAPNHQAVPAWLNYLGLAELFLGREGHGADYFRQALAQQPSGATLGNAAIQQKLNLIAALALDGEIEAAQTLVGQLREQNPALSTRTLTLINCRCSRQTNFIAGLERVRRGLILAGLPDV